jgi:hypothetical protein
MKDLKTVGDLRRLLADLDDNAIIEVAATPDVNGWTQSILDCLHREDGVVILGLSEGCCEDERDLEFRDADGDIVRPV